MINNRSLKDICKFIPSVDRESFVGLKIVEGNPIICLPIGYNEMDDITSSDVDNLLTSIKVYSNDKNEEKGVDNNSASKDAFPYFSYKWIIEDFLSNGYYNDIEYIETKGISGKINWKKTLSRPCDIITNSGFIYSNFVVRKSNINDSTILTRIHEYCVYDSFQKLWWLFGKKIQLGKPLIEIDENNCVKYIKILEKKYNETFLDYKKELIKNMLNILIGIDSKSGKKRSIECGTKNYNVVWEKMIDQAFSTVKNKEPFKPFGKWEIDGNVFDSSKLTPDTISIFEDKMFIYDSKYYPYSIGGGLPQTDSIQKQITYGEYIDNNYGNEYKYIYNAFILPGYIGGDSNTIKYIGKAFSSWKKNDKPYHIIYSFIMDTKFIINNYSNKPKDLLKERIVSLSEKELLL